MQVHRSVRVEMSRITTLLRQGSHGTKSSINGLGQHILMKGLLVREYLASDANAIDCIHWPTRTRERTRGPGKEKQILPVDYPRLVSQHCLPKIFYVNKILVHQKQQ